MDIAGHNMHKDSIDVNNFWVWSTAIWDGVYFSPTSKFVPKFWTWVTAANNGYVSDGVPSVMKFGDKTLTCTVQANYYPAVFLDLPPAKYTLSFNSTDKCNVRLIRYIKLPTGTVIHSGDWQTVNCEAGHNIIGLDIFDNSCVLLGLNGRPEGVWATLSDIRIREGVAR